ncbi:hypothetical protein [Poseidonibacter ostreae]|uniref:Uncharacterized protein n=1 Tax=Poseidonibacter ostreae TaxID=2654171 RepID=A0A6L4WWC9_9BACT|nr:hypothetical protein [Poseidonibacter ostreae]KAB7891362.1 hypothetical protein GBG19_00570 [Poseidonibacter ostreae]
MSITSKRRKMQKLYKALTLIALIFAITIMINTENLEKLYKTYEFKTELEHEYFIYPMNLNIDGFVEFEGYKNNECSKSLVTTSSNVDFSNKVSFDRYKAVAYYYEGKLHVANYIKKYTTLELLNDYITFCANEVKSNRSQSIENLKSWNKTN